MISIIIPTLNEAKYLGQTLRAFRPQDYNKKFEIIVADSKSKDRTAAIARRFGAKVLIVSRSGPAHARNAGAAVAAGDILAFLDADTVPAPNWLSEIEKTFKKKRIVAATCWIVPLSAQLRDFLIYAIFNNIARGSFKLRRPMIAGTAFVVRRSAFERAGGFNEKIFITEDMELAARLRRFGRSVFMKNTLVLTSPRRLQKWGRYRSIRAYVTNYLRVLTFKKSWPMKKFALVR